MPEGKELNYEAKKEKEAAILKVSEAALFVDQPNQAKEKIGEVGNISYRERPGMFIYDPEVGLLVDGQDGGAELKNDDLIALPHDRGHVRVKDFFQDKPANLSDREFQSQLNEFFRQVDLRLKMIFEIGKIAGLKLQDHDVEFHGINEVVRKSKQYSAKDLLNAYVCVLEDDRDIDQDKIKDLKDSMERIKVITDDISDTKGMLVNYFYLYERLKGADISDGDNTYKELEDFPFLYKLLKEFDKSSESFGDSLVDACQRIKNEQE